MERQVQVHVERALDDLEELQVVTFDNKTSETLLEVLDPASTSDAIKQKWVDFYDNIDKEILPGTNSSMSSISSWSTQAMQARQRVDWGGRNDRIIPPFKDSVDQRTRLAASLAKSKSTTDVSKSQHWQKRIAVGTLVQPMSDGPSCQDQSRWPF